jgi:hypothetical protein
MTSFARTKLVSLLAALGVLAAVLATRGGFLDAAGSKHLGSYLLVGFPLFTAAATWWCAAMMHSASTRTQWFLLGAAAFAFGAGQFMEEFMNLAEASGFTVAKLMYVLAILAFGAGVIMALLSFRGFLDVRRPLGVAALVAVGVTVVGGVGVAGFVARLSVATVDKALLVAYPVGLLWLMAMPAFALALTVSQMGAGSLARPWWLVFGGVLLLAISNTMLIAQTAAETPLSNAGPVEIGWWIGLSLISVGAALQIDVQRPTYSVREGAMSGEAH